MKLWTPHKTIEDILFIIKETIDIIKQCYKPDY